MMKRSKEINEKNFKTPVWDIRKNKLFLNFLLILIFTIILFFITIQKVETKRINVKIGDAAPLEIRATKDIVDKQATEQLEKEAANRVEPRYRISPSVQMTMKTTMKEFFDMVRELQLDESVGIGKKTDILVEESRIPLSRNEHQTALRMESNELNSFENLISDLTNQIMGAGIKEEDLEYEKENVVKIFESIEISDSRKELGISLINNTIQPNKFIDEEATQRRIDEEVEKIEPVIIKEHQVIVRKGDIIDSNVLNIIKELGILKEKEGYDRRTVLGIITLIILLEIVVFGYIFHFNSELMDGNRLLILLIIVTALILISQGIYNISPFIMPVSAGALLIAILLDIRLSLIVNIFLVFILSFILKLDDTLMTMYLISGSIGAFLVIRQHQRYNILINGLLIGVSNLLTILSFGLIKKLELMDILIKGGYGLMNGMFCAVLTIGTLPLWENVFEVLTPLKLLELSNPNQPLLKRLLIEAPGTYHHSIIVGNLSERAAEVIGADPLISRVGAYYHDIGKLSRPYFFKENQLGSDNPHDKLKPSMSTLIITNHAKDGIALGKKNKLPKEIIDIIAQHHGDTVVSYFYHKAKQNESLEPKIEDFRYLGPKPQTKEAAIVMLADSTEAAVRSIKEPTKKNIEEMIRNIIRGKLEDGQLEECDLTLKSLNDIANAFSSVMMGIFHERIEYPNSDLVKKKGDA
ncbi:HD family phosphohydrolase [Clostridium sp. Cult2]|uniref:HD family phosphohydrolase n=1 Tax=Clostridium sp. Cult2 TaxID=2079003 RepID=UPI001F3752CB|nr:HDIG domain-containing metalloprotein [Clostridium sp. Cult2]MCF6466530.1 phosphohydrolase [Clostridium sp. Cult2]